MTALVWGALVLTLCRIIANWSWRGGGPRPPMSRVQSTIMGAQHQLDRENVLCSRIKLKRSPLTSTNYIASIHLGPWARDRVCDHKAGGPLSESQTFLLIWALAVSKVFDSYYPPIMAKVELSQFCSIYLHPRGHKEMRNLTYARRGNLGTVRASRIAKTECSAA